MKDITSIHNFGPFLKRKKLLGDCAEIGVAEGRFSLEMMLWGFKKIYLVDNWRYMPGQFGDGGQPDDWHKKNLAMVKDKMKPYKAVFLQGDSIAMADKVKNGSLSFIWLDANHAEEAVGNDLEAWLPKLKKGGIMSGHDYNSFYGVKKAVDEFCFKNGSTGIVKFLPENGIEENFGFWFYADYVR